MSIPVFMAGADASDLRESGWGYAAAGPPLPDPIQECGHKRPAAQSFTTSTDASRLSPPEFDTLILNNG